MYWPVFPLTISSTIIHHKAPSTSHLFFRHFFTKLTNAESLHQRLSIICGILWHDDVVLDVEICEWIALAAAIFIIRTTLSKSRYNDFRTSIISKHFDFSHQARFKVVLLRLSFYVLYYRPKSFQLWFLFSFFLGGGTKGWTLAATVETLKRFNFPIHLAHFYVKKTR